MWKNVNDRGPVRWGLVLLTGYMLAFGAAQAQGVPQIGNRMEFAGVTIHLTESTQYAVQQEAELLYLNRSLVRLRLEQMSLYFPVIRPLLEEHSLPTDFLFLALQDSAAFPPGPVPGFWALPKTNPLGLRVDAAVDERLHLTSASGAAIDRLKQLSRRSRNWIDVIRHFDRILRADTTAAGHPNTDQESFFALTDTHDDFLIRLLASKTVLERAFSLYHPARQEVLFQYEEAKGKTVRQLAEEFEVAEADLHRHNRWLKGSQVPPDRELTVFIPVSVERLPDLRRRAAAAAQNAVARQDAGFPMIQKETMQPDERGAVFHRINGKKGIQALLYDNPITLAYRGRISVEEFLRYNDLQRGEPVFIGEVYYLEKKEKRAKVPFHVVAKGQSLREIAQQYGIQLASLITYNDLNPEQKPAPGRILWLQKKRPDGVPVEYFKPEPSDRPPVTATAYPSSPSSVPSRPDSATARPASAQSSSALTVQTTPSPADSLTPLPDQRLAVAGPAPEPVIRSGATKTVRPTVTPPESAPVSPPVSEPAESETESEEAGPLIMHLAEQGDTYASVARRYNVTVRDLLLWNNLSAGKPLRAGQSLLIDLARPSRPASKAAVPAASGGERTHVVRYGENLFRIGLKYQVTAEQLRRWNHLPDQQAVMAGQTLVVGPADPGTVRAAAEEAETAKAIIHTVKSGENLFRIGLKYNVTPEQIREWNNLPNLTAVKGTRLVIRRGN